ncbi:MAG: hypothetical protein HY865_17840 [Chloroflexi bacterium]|nr:hypothetical protein [Chloroflexota bacterium]
MNLLPRRHGLPQMMKVCLASAKVKTLLQGFWLFDPGILDGIIITAQESYAYNFPSWPVG